MKRKKNILAITYWSYKEALIQTYTLPYLHIIHDQLAEGSKIFLITLEQKQSKMSNAEKALAKKLLLEKGIRLIALRYKKPNLLSAFYWLFVGLFLLGIIFFRRIKYLHAWCTPAGSIGYLLSLFSGRPLVIDSYEPHAEAMVQNKTWKENGFQFKVLFFFEKKLSNHATIIISATEKMKEYALEKYNASFKKFYVKPACVDMEQFSLANRKKDELIKQFNFEEKIVCVYAGKFGGIYLTNEVFDFFKVGEDYWGDKFRGLLLTSHKKSEIQNWCTQSGFDMNKLAIRFVNHADIPDYIGLGDFAITPVKPIPTKRYCTPIKDGEYWALGLPVVIPKNISDDSEIIETNNIGAVLTGFDNQSYLVALKKIESILSNEKSTALYERIRSVAMRYRNFSIAQNIYRKIYSENE